MARLLATAVALAAALPGCLALLDGTAPRPAPDFAIIDTAGAPRTLASYNGSVLVVDLMATWCVPCRAQMEHLNALRAAYPEERVQILSVGTDASEPDRLLEAFSEQYGGRWPFARDTDRVAQKYGLRILPKLLIVDPDGRIVFENQGETYPAAMTRVINRYADVRT